MGIVLIVLSLSLEILVILEDFLMQFVNWKFGYLRNLAIVLTFLGLNHEIFGINFSIELIIGLNFRDLNGLTKEYLIVMIRKN